MKFAHSLLGLALVSFSLSTAQAGPMEPAPEPAGPEIYIFGYGGINWIDGFDTSAPGLDVDLDADTGWGVGGGLGVRSDAFGGSRLEIEGLYRENDADSVSVNGNPILAEGDFQTVGVQVNFLKELPTVFGLRPYAGVGIGWANVEADVDYRRVFIRDDANGFAWQAIAGLDLPLSDKLSLYTEYRYFNLEGGDLTRNTPGGPIEVDIDDFNTHSVFVGLRIFF